MVVHASNRNAELLDAYRKQFALPLGKSFEIVAQRGHGSFLWDADGDRFLDFTSGMGGNIVGHCHPAVIAEVKKQIDQLVHTGSTACHKPAMELTAKLAEIGPHGLDGVRLCSSWKEALAEAEDFVHFHAASGYQFTLSDTRLSSPGRCGSWFAASKSDADIVLFGNAVASGFPLGGFFANKELLAQWLTERPATADGDGDNAVSCAAALATIRVIQHEGLIESAQKLTTRLDDRLHALQHGTIGDVTVNGLCADVEIVEPASRIPHDARRFDVLRACFERKLLVVNNLSARTIRFLPPLNCTTTELDNGLDVFVEALATI